MTTDDSRSSDPNDPPAGVAETSAPDVQLDLESHQAQVEQLIGELADRDRLITELETELSQYRNNCKTWPPSEGETTADLSRDAQRAKDIMQVGTLATRVETLGSEVFQMRRQFDSYQVLLERAERLGPLIERMTDLLSDGVCAHCPNRPPPPTSPPKGPPLSVVPASRKAGGGE